MERSILNGLFGGKLNALHLASLAGKGGPKKTGKVKIRIVNKSAVTGEFVSDNELKRNPNTTYRLRVRTGK